MMLNQKKQHSILQNFYAYPLLQIIIFTDKQLPFVWIQAPFSLPLQVNFSFHSRPPFIQLNAPPSFYKQFQVQVMIQEFNLHQLSDQAFPFDTSLIFCSSYLFPFILPSVIVLTPPTMTTQDPMKL